MLQYIGPVLLKTSKVIKHREILKHYHSQNGFKEAWQPNVMWGPGGDPGTEKNIIDKH